MTLSDADIARCIDFHGHSCPGLAIGMHAASFCLNEFGHNSEMDLVAICETDMCGVDAIQLLTGCTIGKGNLIHRDYGKVAFTFYSRKNDEGKRIIFNQEVEERFKEFKVAVDTASSDQVIKLRDEFRVDIVDMRFDELFRVMEPLEAMPRPAAVLNTLHCESCGEAMMESRARLFGGKTYCIPCFKGVEQKF